MPVAQSCAHLEEGPPFPTVLTGALWTSGGSEAPDHAEPQAASLQLFRL